MRIIFTWQRTVTDDICKLCSDLTILSEYWENLTKLQALI